jgi:hypothetical protein
MKTKRSPLFWASLGGVVFIATLGLAACAPYSLAADEPTQSRTTESGYPGPPPSADMPTQLPLPTDADGSPNDLYSYFATPAPDETVEVVNIVESQPVQPTPVYHFENIRIGEGINWIMVLKVTDPKTGKQVRLGDDSGSAVIGALNDELVLWFFVCDPCRTLKAGLYAHWFSSGKDVWIDNQTILIYGSVEIWGEWVTYLKPPEKSSYHTANSVQLYLYNLRTGEKLLISKHAVHILAGSLGYRAVNEDQVAWMEDGRTVNDWTLHVYDLKAHSARQINVDLKDVRYLSVSRNMVVWWDVFWKGYDLTREALFTIPIIPPGWDNNSVQRDGPVTALGNTLHWSLTVDGTPHYFTASLVPKGQGPQVTHAVPTPQRKPAVSPVAVTPTPVPLPTAYPEA